MKISRRRFLGDSLLALAAASAPAGAIAAPAGRARRPVSPNEKIHAAVVGLHGRGMSHVNAYAGMDDVEIVALCDADTATFAEALRAIAGHGRPEPRTFQDIRKMLEQREIDVVSFATPNHWHAPGAIWAMQAGKDVYVEKPVSHNVFEGRKMVEAARVYRRICQAGTQSRSNPGLAEGVRYIREGHIGQVKLARGLCYKRRKSIGRVTDPTQVPSTVDYSLWLGPAPQKPPMRAQFHYDWHWFWDYGNGDLGNQGSHEMDKARWGLGKTSLPRSVVSLGGRFGYRDNAETPNTLISVMDYGDSQIIFEVRGLPTPDLKGAMVGNIWYGSEGVAVAPSYNRCVIFDNDGKEVKRFEGGNDNLHFRNFIDAVRSRRRRDLNAEIEEGHVSAALCHLANISYRLGSFQPFNSHSRAFGDDSEAYETFGRFEEHLTANGMQLAAGDYRLGKKLCVDAAHERFIGSSAADRLLTRDYRAPFVVPDRV